VLLLPSFSLSFGLDGVTDHQRTHGQTQQRCRRQAVYASSSGDLTDSLLDVESATDILQDWDRSFNSETVPAAAVSDDDRERLRPAIRRLNEQASCEREDDSTQGRVMLGICASSAAQGLATLKSWVPALALPRGLLHGMDKDGVPLDLEGGVYIKYNSGGVYSFSDIRKSGQGFEALWKPGDAMLEPYDGSYRGVYFQVELVDGVFRQFLVPIDVFDPIDSG
jgi:hypothetical protein